MDFTKHVNWINETLPSYQYATCPYTCCEKNKIVFLKQVQGIDFSICVELTQTNKVFIVQQGIRSAWAIWDERDKRFKTGGYHYPLADENLGSLSLLKDLGHTIRRRIQDGL